MKARDKIVFYDGECGLCQRSISILSVWDTKKLLSFAPLNGVTYRIFFKEICDMTTVVFFSEGKLYTKSDAVIEIVKSLGGRKKLLLLLKLIPRFIRDFAYNFIASNRSKVSCTILTKDERFLN